MTPFISSFRRQNHSTKGQETKQDTIKNAGRSDSSSASSSSSNSASNARPSPSSSSSSFSVLLPQTPAEPVSMVEAVDLAMMPELTTVQNSKSSTAQYEGLHFSGSGPFPVLTNSRHSLDPHGLSKYLMNPEDPSYDYLYPVPLRSKTDDPPNQQTSVRPDKARRQSAFSVFGKKPKVAASPLARSPTSEDQYSLAQPDVDQGLSERSNFVLNATAGPNGNSRESLTPTMANRALFTPTGVPQAVQVVQSSTSRSSSAESLESRTASSIASDTTDTTSETKTPLFETDTLPDLHIRTQGDDADIVTPLAKSQEPTPTVASKRPSLMSGSTWKTWLGVHKTDKSNIKKLPVKKPKNLQPAPEVSTALSADPLSGTLPGSIPASTSTLVEEELRVPTQVSARDPECVKAMHRMTLDKLHAIRAVNTSHPAVVDIVDKASYQRNLQLNPAIAQLQSPKSSSRVIGIGSCIFPQADIFSIDVRLINILRKLDARDFGEIEEIKHLSMSAIQSRRDKEKRWSEVARLRKEGISDIGIVKFVERPCFEDRVLDFDSHMQPRQVRAARDLAMLEPEFTAQTQGWVELSRRNQLKRSERLGGVLESSLVSGSALRSRSTSTLEELGSSYATSKKDHGAGKQIASRSWSPVKAISRSSSTLSLWAPTRGSDRKPALMDADEDADSSDSDTSDSEDDTPLSTVRRPPSNAFGPSQRLSTSGQPVPNVQMRSRPPSMLPPLTTPQLLSAAVAGPLVVAQPKKMAQDPAKYRQEYLNSRERMNKARKGDIERERGGEAIRQRTQSTPRSVPSRGQPLNRGAAKDLRIETERKATTAGSASAPTSPRNHSRQISHPAQLPGSGGNVHRPSFYGNPTPQSGLGARVSHIDSTNSLARRSLSHADVRNSMGYTYGMPGMVAPFTNVQQPYMYVPVPMMSFAPMVNPFGMQMPPPQMMAPQPLAGQRRQSAMEVTRPAQTSGVQQRPAATRATSRQRPDGREPVR